jgi:solute carrier family 35 protein E3
MVLLSGLLAAILNISQFFIVARTGAVSSTVVGHVKTCLIVALGWVTSGRGLGDGGVVGGVVVAVGGIIA